MRISTFLSSSLLLLCSSNTFTAAPLPTGLAPQSNAPALPTGLNTAPALPLGLNSSPSLPSGLGSAPSLPSGLNTATQQTDIIEEDSEPFININGFFDIRGGIRTQDDPYQNQMSLGEVRLQLALQKDISIFSFNLVTDFLYDANVDNYDIALDKGTGWIDLREASVAFSPLDALDIKIGRQILTWGTGDLIFINDLFPKDWQAFFTSRDLKYLKAPSDSVKSSFFSKYANIDFIFTPWFDQDRGITGEKLSYFNPMTGSLAGQNAIIDPETPNSEEYALRIYQNFGVNEVALYGYYGFWKSPLGFNQSTGRARYPKMRSLGASIRRPLGPGIVNLEAGYYDSFESGSSSDPFTPNSESRFLIGYEQEVIKNFSIGMQYYIEWMHDYNQYVTSNGTNPSYRKEVRHLLTNRLTLMTHQQNVTWSLFTFFSPSDLDAYFRPKVSYKVTDAWQVETGANFFVGKNDYSFFGQFALNNNVYGSVRYSF
jgi:hypothetical protein